MDSGEFRELRFFRCYSLIPMFISGKVSVGTVLSIISAKIHILFLYAF